MLRNSFWAPLYWNSHSIGPRTCNFGQVLRCQCHMGMAGLVDKPGVWNQVSLMRCSYLLFSIINHFPPYNKITQNNLSCPDSCIKFANVVPLPRMSFPCLSTGEHTGKFNLKYQGFIHSAFSSSTGRIEGFLLCSSYNSWSMTLFQRVIHIVIITIHISITLDLWFLKLAQNLT